MLHDVVAWLEKFEDITCVIHGITLLNTKFQDITCVIHDVTLLIDTKLALLYLTRALRPLSKNK